MSEEAAQTSPEPALTGLRDRLAVAPGRRPGAFQFRLTGEESGDFALEVDGGRRVRLITGASRVTPLNVVSGDGRKIRSVIEGRLDPRTAFLTGGIQFRGDIRYLERLLTELKLHRSAG